MTNFAKRNRMEKTLSARLTRLQEKIDVLGQQRDKALKEAATLREEKEVLARELKTMQEALAQSRLDVEYLKLSHRLADTPESLATSRELIKKLVARIDRALRLIADDAQI